MKMNIKKGSANVFYFVLQLAINVTLLYAAFYFKGKEKEIKEEKGENSHAEQMNKAAYWAFLIPGIVLSCITVLQIGYSIQNKQLYTIGGKVDVYKLSVFLVLSSIFTYLYRNIYSSVKYPDLK